jgi:hypothetical protein
MVHFQVDPGESMKFLKSENERLALRVNKVEHQLASVLDMQGEREREREMKSVT